MHGNVLDSTSLQCFQCNFCNDPFNEEYANIVNCTGSCEKTTKNNHVLRLCSPDYIGDNCAYRRTGNKGSTRKDSCACNEDLCNTGVPTAVITPVTVTVSAIITMLSMRAIY